ncbi:MAG: glutamate racemase [Prochlorothrix sp.]
MTVQVHGLEGQDWGNDRPRSLASPTPAGPIGIFDSGVGGVTVLRELYSQLPQESVIYFGDTARLPYGTRSPQEILAFVQEILGWMASQGVKMAIMACNTSSALALEAVQGQYPFPVLGLILPGAKAAVRQGRRVGVIATPATVSSNAYAQAIQEADPQVQTWQVACPQFVPLIESNQIHTPQMRSVAQAYLEPLIAQEIDTLIYGCTHYPHLGPVLRGLLDPTVQLVNPAVHVVAAAVRELDALGLRHSGSALPTRFYTSGPPLQFATLAAQWLGYQPTVQGLPVAELQRFGLGSPGPRSLPIAATYPIPA